MGKGRRVRASRSTSTRRSVEPHAVGLDTAPLLPRDVVAHVDERDVGTMTPRHVDALLRTVAPDRHARVAAGLIALGGGSPMDVAKAVTEIRMVNRRRGDSSPCREGEADSRPVVPLISGGRLGRALW